MALDAYLYAEFLKGVQEFSNWQAKKITLVREYYFPKIR